MSRQFVIKHRHQLVWDEISRVETSRSAAQNAMNAIMGRGDYFGTHVINIHQFIIDEVGQYDPHFNHRAIEQHVNSLFDGGTYFSVCTNALPIHKAFNWHESENHSDGGEWRVTIHNMHSPHFIEPYLKTLAHKQRRSLAEPQDVAESFNAAQSTVRKSVKETSVKPQSEITPASAYRSPPTSINECEQRLEDARERLIKEGYKSKYTDEQLHAIAQKGELDDRFVVRLIETKYAGDDGYLGQMNGGEIKYWSTTFNQIENADTDPATICGVIGINYDPKKSYTLVIVDTQARDAGQSITIVPTHKNLGDFAKREIKGINPDAVDQVMTPEYNQTYAMEMKRFNSNGLDSSNEEHVKTYAKNKLSSTEDRNKFKARMQINEKLGANEYYTGNGTTKNLIQSCPNESGVMETFTYDKSPQTLGNLESSMCAKRIHTKSIQG